jgi:RNA polymerase sigma factor (sigma-70 family)
MGVLLQLPCPVIAGSKHGKLVLVSVSRYVMEGLVDQKRWTSTIECPPGKRKLRASVALGIMPPPSVKERLSDPTPRGTDLKRDSGSEAGYELFIEHQGLVEALIRRVSLKKGLAVADADDFRSLARLKLLQDECAALRAFKGRSSMATYITIVLLRVLDDYRTSRWGKWRPSKEAVRRGPIAVRLDQLTSRDGLSTDEAIESLATGESPQLSRQALRDLADALPRRPPRKTREDEKLGDAPDAAPGTDDRVVRRELQPLAHRARASLRRALRSLTPQARLVLRLHFIDGLKVSHVAKVVRLPSKPLYRQINVSLSRLRVTLEAEGIDRKTVRDLLVQPWSDLFEQDPDELSML